MPALLLLALLSLGIGFGALLSSGHAAGQGNQADVKSGVQLFVPQQLHAGKRSPEAVFLDQSDPALATMRRFEAPLVTSSFTLSFSAPARSAQRRPWTARSPPVIR